MKRIAVLVVELSSERPDDIRVISDEEYVSDEAEDEGNGAYVCVSGSDFEDLTNKRVILDATLEDFVEDLRKREDFNKEV